MATVPVRTADLQSGDLPPVCALTGEPAASYARMEFTNAPTWTLALLPLGVLPFLAVRLCSRSRATARIPLSARALRRGLLFNRVQLSTVGIGFILLALGALVGAVLAWAGLAVILLSLVALAIGRALMWPRGRVRDTFVRLSGVHPDFALAVAQAQASSPPRPGPTPPAPGGASRG